MCLCLALQLKIYYIFYISWHGSSRELTKFKSTNFYRIIKSFVSVRNDAYTRRSMLGWRRKTLKQHFSTFSIFISFFSNGSAQKSYKKYQIYGVYNFMPSFFSPLPCRAHFFLLEAQKLYIIFSFSSKSQIVRILFYGSTNFFLSISFHGKLVTIFISWKFQKTCIQPPIECKPNFNATLLEVMRDASTVFVKFYIDWRLKKKKESLLRQ